MKEIEEYIKNKVNAESISSISKQTAKNNISGLSLTLLYKKASSTISSYLSGSKISSGIVTLVHINPQTAFFALGLTVAVSFITKLANSYFYDGKTKENENEIFKSTHLWEKVRLLIYEFKWEENNIILAAISAEKDCNTSEVQFDFCKM